MKVRNIIMMAGVVAVTSLILASCNLYKKYETPADTPITEEYKKAVEAGVDSAAFGNLQWEQVFTDPVLADLIRKALETNSDIQNAMLNVEAAQARLEGAKLSFLPSVVLAPSGNVSKFFVDGVNWGRTYNLPLQVSWEADIFGKLLNSKRGAKMALMQSEAYAQAVRSQIICAVANTYYAIAYVQGEIQLSRATAENWKQSVQTMRDLKESGKLNESAVVQSEAQYYGILASITDLEVSLDELNNTMSMLLDCMPQKWTVSPEAALEVPSIYRDGVPMRELAARPDVRAAEYSLAAAYYTTAGARAAFYPSLNIALTGGFTNSVGNAIMNPGKFFIDLAGSLVAPLFSRGANRANLKVAKAQQQQALNNFEDAILSASAEVSNAMVLYSKTLEKEDLLKKQCESLEKSVEITQTLLSLGSFNTTYLEVLTAQTNLLSARMGLLTCQNNKARAIIGLYQSLGGGR